MFLNKKRRCLNLSFALINAIIIACVIPALAESEIPLTDNTSQAEYPDVAVDSNGNIHVAYSDDVDSDSREIWYTMLDSSGKKLIENTRITDDDNAHSVRPSICVDSNNKVHIVWQDQGGDAITYTKLNPYADDRNGDVAVSETITIVDEST